MLRRLGRVCLRKKLTIGTLRALAVGAEGNAVAMARIAEDMATLGQAKEAAEIAAKAARLEPDNAAVAAIALRLRNATVPDWHFNIVRDTVRNDLYDTALKRAVKSGDKVLEIGTGTGLLAMMAARAGAGIVYTCEANPAVAAFAKLVIAKNGYPDVVQVIAKHSDQVTVEDIGGPADLLVSEIVSSDLLGEFVLAVMEDVVPRLVKPDGIIIPHAGAVCIGLVEDNEAILPLDVVAGFDLSAFNPLRRSTYKPKDRASCCLRGVPVDLFAFDFRGIPQPPSQTKTSVRATGGRVTGLAQWIRIDLDSEVAYENPPGWPNKSCWYLSIVPAPRPLALAPGCEITVHARHNRTKVDIRVDWP
jgi:hypothetical protein